MTNATPSCQGCGAKPHPAGRTQCLAYNVTCFHCQKVGNFAKVCRSESLYKHTLQPPVPESFQQLPQPTQPVGTTPKGIKTIICSDSENQHSLPHIQHVTTNEAAPTIHVHVTSLNGSREIEMLPDSGADISAAGKEILNSLGEHADNLPQSGITPRAVNGTAMEPLGKLPVTLRLGNK